MRLLIFIHKLISSSFGISSGFFPPVRTLVPLPCFTPCEAEADDEDDEDGVVREGVFPNSDPNVAVTSLIIREASDAAAANDADAGVLCPDCPDGVLVPLWSGVFCMMCVLVPNPNRTIHYSLSCRIINFGYRGKHCQRNIRLRLRHYTIQYVFRASALPSSQ